MARFWRAAARSQASVPPGLRQLIEHDYQASTGTPQRTGTMSASRGRSSRRSPSSTTA